MVYTSRIRGNADRRPQAFWGAFIPAAINFVGGLITSSQQAKAQKRALEEQQRLAQQQLQVSNQNQLANTLNNYASAQQSYNDKDYNLKYRIGGVKRLGGRNIMITDGGNAKRIGNNTYLLRGGSHEDINETGQTGIGINVGGNEIEAEGGEVAQRKGNSLRIYSAQPILGGMSPAQAIMRGYNKDKVFNAQQRFKKRNHLSDSGGKAKYGTIVPYKRIHINEDGTFTDTLTGKVYNISATNGEDVVITGKANHWKEAGKKDTSSYFDPMGAVNFATAVAAPILNANPSNIVGSIRDSKNASDFLKHYMMQDTGGFVNTKWAKEHPYLSLGINTIGDIGLGYGLGKTGVSLYRLRPSNLRKHIFENISPIGYDKPIPRIKEAFKSALSGAEADIDNPSWFNDKSAQDLNTYNVGITKNMFGPHALEARFDAWRKYLGLPQKFNTWTESPIVKGAYTDTKGISNLKVLPKDQSVDFINSAGGNVANNIEEFTTRGYNGQKYGVSHIRDTWDLQPWSRLRGNIIEDKVIRPLYNSTIGKANRKVSSSLHKFINKYSYDNEAIQKYLNENGEEALDNLSDVIEYFADTKSIKGKLAHKLSGLDDVLNDKAYYTINKDSKLSKLTNKLSDKIKNFEASSLLPGAKPFKIAYDIPWTNEVFPNNEMVKGFNMINTLPTEAYRYKLKNPLLDYTYRLGGRCKLRNGGLTSKDRGSSKHPYPSVSSKDFAGGNRSYPIPTKADAIDALRLAGLHGRSDVRSKVYNKYPELRKKAAIGTLVPGGIPGTDSYRGRMYSGYDVSPINLLNFLNYLDRAAGFVDEDGNSRYITGIAPTPGRGKMSNKALLRQARRANNRAMINPVIENTSTIPTSPVKPGYTWNGTRITTRFPYAGRGMEQLDMRGFTPYNSLAKETPTYSYTISQDFNPNNNINLGLGSRLRGNVEIGTGAAKQKINKFISKTKAKVTNPNTYRTRTGFEERYNPNIGAYEQYNTYKFKPWVKGAARTAGVASAMGIGVGLAKINSKDKNTKAQLDAKGQPISPYIARPQEPVKPQAKPQAKKVAPARRDTVVTKPATRQVPDSIARKDTTRTDTTKQVNKVIKRQVRTTPQYTGNTTRGNYQLHDGETKTINGVKYTRRGNTIINHKTNVGYIYDKNGNYTGQADYSKVGNFNQAFDAARAAGRSQFIYRAGKYQNYSTNKETDAKKEALNRRVGARRIAKRMGGLTNPPVGSRKKYLPGGTANPWDKYEVEVPYPIKKNDSPIYDNPWNEYKVPDYGGTAPWQISNKYDVKVPYPIGKHDLPITTITAKKDTFNDEMSRRMRAGVQNLKDSSDTNGTVPYLGRQSSFSPKAQDYIGLGIDTLAALGSGMFTRSAYNKMNFDYALPSYVDETPVAFDTTYHNEAQRANIERNRLNSRSLITGNTSSAQTALDRMQKTDTDAMMETNKLLDEKTNKEVELRNQNAANEQQVRARNAAARNQYYQNVAQIKNAALEARNNMELAKAQSIGTDLSGLSQAWTNFASSVENRYDARQNEIAAISSANSPSVVKNAISLGYNLSPEVLANLYKNSKNDELRNAILGRLSANERKRYGIK